MLRSYGRRRARRRRDSGRRYGRRASFYDRFEVIAWYTVELLGIREITVIIISAPRCAGVNSERIRVAGGRRGNFFLLLLRILFLIREIILT